MKKKLKETMTMAVLLALLCITGCPQTDDGGNNNSGGVPGQLVTAIRIGGVPVSPLPAGAASIDAAAAVQVVVSTERSPTADEPAGVYYKPVQPVTVSLANAQETAYFTVTAPDEIPADIELPGQTVAGKNVTRDISITVNNSNRFPEGRVVWLKVVAADESKTEYYQIRVIAKTHDTAADSITVGGTAALDLSQSPHIGPWQSGAAWADAAAALVNLKAGEASNAAVTVTPRNNAFELSRPTVEYAKIPAANASNPVEPAAWSAAAPASFANHDILAIKVTASNGTTAGFFKVTVNVGGSPFLASLKVNGTDITLGAPSSDIAAVGGAYRVEEGRTLTAAQTTWSVAPVADDSNAAVTWALVAKRVIPQAGDFTSSTSFDTSHNYLFIKVISATGEFTRYYLVVFDERPKTVEHVTTGAKCVPIYKFTIPANHPWSEMGTYPKVRMTILQEEYQFNRADGYQRNFVFGEASKFPQWNAGSSPANFSVGVGGIGSASWAVLMPLIINKQVSAWAVAGVTPAPGMWFTVEYPLAVPPDTIKQPWDSNTNLSSTQGYQRENYWPAADKTGDVYFGIGITHDEQKEYWIKELALVSEDGSLVIPCNLYDETNDTGGDGRIDSTSRSTGYVMVETQANVTYLREMAADPTLR
jgi:hypothetical protein